MGYRENFSITLPSHPQASTRGEYLNYSPFTKYLCTLAPFGSFMIDPAWCADDKTIKFTAQIDGITGKACLQICREDSIQGSVDFFHLSTAMFGVPIQLSQVTQDLVKPIVSALNASASVGRGDIIGAAKGIGSAILEGLSPQVQTTGSFGSKIAFEENPHVFVEWYTIVDEYNIDIGRPLCAPRTINSLSGYIECENAEIELSATKYEIEEVIRYLNNGFFYE